MEQAQCFLCGMPTKDNTNNYLLYCEACEVVLTDHVIVKCSQCASFAPLRPHPNMMRTLRQQLAPYSLQPRIVIVVNGCSICYKKGSNIN